jgi:Ca2+-binding EF-hand superfamily protein
MTKIIDRLCQAVSSGRMMCLVRMDVNRDGMITYDEFVQCVKDSANSDMYRCADLK